MKVLEIRSSKRVELIEITHLVTEEIRSSGVERGICFIYNPHTTAGLIINEHADPDVARDIEETLSRLIPEKANYRHLEGNADAHIKSTLVGNELFVFIEEGRPVMGTWQGIFFCEFDGPRRRKVYLKIVEDK